MQLKAEASHEVGAPPEKVFDFATAVESFPCILHHLGPIPAIESVTMLDGAAPATGARRRVRMSDNSELLEEIVELDRPRRHRYRWLTRPAPPFSLLVRSAEADWLFTASAKGTRIDWTYTFELTSPLAAPAAKALLLLFKRWMQRGLERIGPFVHG